VIDDVRVRVRPVPEATHYEAWFLPGWEEGITAFRALAQDGTAPDVLRLSDPGETEVGLILSGPGGWQGRLLDAYLGARGVRGGCFALVGWEGTDDRIKSRRKPVGARLRKAGGVGLGSAGVGSWERTRFEGPYLRDELMDMGVLVDTLETSHTWSRLPELYAAVRRGIQESLGAKGTPPIVLCHISHVYPDGASLYFSLMARALPGSELEQWREAKTAACEAIVGAGGTITHHHAVGTDHAPYMRAEVGELGLDVLRAVKDDLDPNGIMNPGKLLPA
jgi:alkyldihydroxyacetonephosphate synthase